MHHGEESHLPYENRYRHLTRALAKKQADMFGNSAFPQGSLINRPQRIARAANPPMDSISHSLQHHSSDFQRIYPLYHLLSVMHKLYPSIHPSSIISSPVPTPTHAPTQYQHTSILAYAHSDKFNKIYISLSLPPAILHISMTGEFVARQQWPI